MLLKLVSINKFSLVIIHYLLWDLPIVRSFYSCNIIKTSSSHYTLNNPKVALCTNTAYYMKQNDYSSTSNSNTSGIGFGITKNNDIETSLNKNKDINIIKEWNIKGLKHELTRKHERTFKKIGKAYDKLNCAEQKYNEIIKLSNPTLEQLESCPDVELYRKELNELKSLLESLTKLDEKLKGIKSSSDKKFLELLDEINILELSDESPPKQERGPTKVKSIPTGPRIPYLTYKSIDNIEIRVGRSASDNDELSCNPNYRDNTNWWLHASGCPGSHVVIRSDIDDLVDIHKQTVIDAALLAAVNSKAKQSGKVQVNLTRCRNVSKPKDAKPGLVYLKGDVLTITIDLKLEINRLERLQKIL